MHFRRFLALFALLLPAGLCLAFEAPPAQPAKSPEPARVLFLGNSITLHPPAKGLGWEGNWGMAASAEAKDYVHLVVDGLAKRAGKVPKFRAVNIADFERGYATYDSAAKLKDELAFQPGIVVLAIGENVPALVTDEAKAAFKESLIRLFTLLKSPAGPQLYVRSCFWADAAKDAALKDASTAVGATFIDIGALSKIEANYARSERKIEHAGVANHPGDAGMKAIADAILGAMKNSVPTPAPIRNPKSP
jgi:hypothetical protein